MGRITGLWLVLALYRILNDKEEERCVKLVYFDIECAIDVKELLVDGSPCSSTVGSSPVVSLFPIVVSSATIPGQLQIPTLSRLAPGSVFFHHGGGATLLVVMSQARIQIVSLYLAPLLMFSSEGTEPT